MMGIEWLRPAAFLGSMLYALIGVVIFWLCFVIVDKITPVRPVARDRRETEQGPGPGGGGHVPGHQHHRGGGDPLTTRRAAPPHPRHGPG